MTNEDEHLMVLVMVSLLFVRPLVTESIPTDPDLVMLCPASSREMVVAVEVELAKPLDEEVSAYQSSVITAATTC